MFKSRTFNFPISMCGIQAIRVSSDDGETWYVESLDQFGRARVRDQFNSKDDATLEAERVFFCLAHRAVRCEW